MPASKAIPLADVNLKEIAHSLQNGELAVIPTDTIYGITGSAKSESAVEKIYKLRKRTGLKPMIVLISSLKQIEDLGVKISAYQKQIFKKLWPDKISIVIDCPPDKLHYLHRGKNSLAFRMPDNKFLSNLIELSGPIVAPSANFEGENPSLNIKEAKKYFGNSVSFYVDSGDLISPPSTVVSLQNSKPVVLREGAVKISGELLK